MEAVIHSHFLQALGFALVNSLWQFALVWLIYIMLDGVTRLTSHQKYCAAIIMQFAGFIWFIATFFSSLSQSSASHNTAAATLVGYNIQINVNYILGERFLVNISKAGQLLSYLSIAYLCLLVFFLAKLSKAYSYTRNVKSQGLQKIDGTWRVFVQKLSTQLGIKHQVRIYLSEKIQTPLTIGFFKPLILIPLASINHLKADQMEAIILHELAHIKRFDYIFNLFLTLIETLLFFNPFTILLGRYIKRERENCCDDWVLQYEYNAASYARALLQIATCQNPSSILALKAAGDKKVLLTRIKRMIGKKEESFFKYRYQLAVLFVMTLFFTCVALLSPTRNSGKKFAASIVESHVSQLFTSNVSDKFFNPALLFKNSSNDAVLPENKANYSGFAGSQTPLVTKRAGQNHSNISFSISTPVAEIPEQSDVLMVNDKNEQLLAHIAKAKAETSKIQATAHQKQLENLAVLSAGRAMENDKTIQNLVIVLDRLKTIKLKLELTKLSNTVTPEVISVLTQSLATIPATITYSQADLNLLISQIKTELKEVKEQYNQLPKLDDNEVSVNFSDDDNSDPELPETQGYSFSYGSSEKPASPAKTATFKNARRRKNKEDDFSQILPVLPLPEVAPAPPTAPAGKTVTARKNYFIVKI